MGRCRAGAECDPLTGGVSTLRTFLRVNTSGCAPHPLRTAPHLGVTLHTSHPDYSMVMGEHTPHYTHPHFAPHPLRTAPHLGRKGARRRVAHRSAPAPHPM